MTRLALALLAAGVVAAACHHGDARSPGQCAYCTNPAWVVLMKEDPPAYCMLRGSVASSKNPGYEDLQHQAAMLGATHVVLDGTRATGVTWGYRVKNELFGRAYSCPPPPGNIPPPAPSSQPAAAASAK